MNRHPRPLALYWFGTSRAHRDRVLRETISGGVTINDACWHVAQENLPFGGVGASGMGAYHGERGFLTFTKEKPVLHQARVQRHRAVPAAVRPPLRGRARAAQALLLNVATFALRTENCRHARRTDAGSPAADLVADRARERVPPARRDRLAHRRRPDPSLHVRATSAAARSRWRRRCGRSASSRATGSRRSRGTATGTWSSISACPAWAPCCTRSIRGSFPSRSSTSSIMRRTSTCSSTSRSCRCWRGSRRR